MQFTFRGLCLFVAFLSLVPFSLLSQSSAPPKFIEGYCDCSTPLSVAVDRNDAESVKTLVAQGADVTMKFYDRHLRQGDAKSLPGRTTLDLAQINLSHRSSAAKGQPSVETQAALERACSIYTLLKEHGATASSASARFGTGDPACSASQTEKKAEMASLEKQDAAKDQQRLALDQSKAKYMCSTGAMASFYSCSCFTDKVTEYRSTHGTKEPFDNITSKLDYSSCLGPQGPMEKYASDRARKTLESSRLDTATIDQVAACTGPVFATAYRAQYASLPGLRQGALDSLFTKAFYPCTQKYKTSAR